MSSDNSYGGEYHDGADVTNHSTYHAGDNASVGGANSVLGNLPVAIDPKPPFTPAPIPQPSHVFDPPLPNPGYVAPKPGALVQVDDVHNTGIIALAETHVEPPKPPIEFYAADRWHAMTHLRQLFGISDHTRDVIIAELHQLMHTGPVHVSISPADPEFDPEHTPDNQAYAVKPINYVRV